MNCLYRIVVSIHLDPNFDSFPGLDFIARRIDDCDVKEARVGDLFLVQCLCGLGQQSISLGPDYLGNSQARPCGNQRILAIAHGDPPGCTLRIDIVGFNRLRDYDCIDGEGIGVKLHGALTVKALIPFMLIRIIPSDRHSLLLDSRLHALRVRGRGHFNRHFAG